MDRQQGIIHGYSTSFDYNCPVCGVEYPTTQNDNLCVSSVPLPVILSVVKDLLLLDSTADLFAPLPAI